MADFIVATKSGFPEAGRSFGGWLDKPVTNLTFARILTIGSIEFLDASP